MNYEIHPRRFWKRKEGFSGYEIQEKGFSIYDRRNNTFSNYFFGKIGIDTKEEAENIILRLTSK